MKNCFPQRILIIAVILIGTIFIDGCSGCSRSGIRNSQKANSHSNSTPKASPPIGSSTTPSSEKGEDLLPSNMHLSLNKLYEKYSPTVFLIYTSDGSEGFQGTGFFVSKDGIAISNYHVFKNTKKGEEIIMTHDGEQFKIEEVLETSDTDDYIIFKVALANYQIENPIPISEKEPQIGDDVFAIGNPKGLESTLSKGIVSGYRLDRHLIQTTTEITHGSSGGPLLNMIGQVVGITTAGLEEANLNFAVNINQVPISKYISGK